MTGTRIALIATIAGVALPVVGLSGVYLATVDCVGVDASGNFCKQGEDDNSQDISAGAIVHPRGWDGTQAIVEMTVCTSPSPGDAGLVEPTRRAVETWNSLQATVANCPRCVLAENLKTVNEGRSDIYHAESVILHELGHCALGLDHSNLFFDDPGDDDCSDCDPEARIFTSFTASYGGVKIGILVGADGIRGSGDDEHRALFGQIADNVHWFRTNDNNPVIVDGGLIDYNSYRQNIDELPAPDTWAAGANVGVSLDLLEPGVQSVMYSPLARDTDFRGLSADDVNTVKMGMAGANRVIGGGDDYTISLTFVESCVGADVQVGYAVLDEAVLGECPSGVLPSLPTPPPVPAHYTTRGIAGLRAELRLNSLGNWDEGPPFSIFVDSFETGDTSQWSATVP